MVWSLTEYHPRTVLSTPFRGVLRQLISGYQVNPYSRGLPVLKQSLGRPPVRGLFATRTPGVGGPRRGGTLAPRSGVRCPRREPPPGAQAVCGPVRPSRPSGRAVRPSLRAPVGLRGSPPGLRGACGGRPPRLSRPRAARRAGLSAPCGGCRGLVRPPRCALPVWCCAAGLPGRRVPPSGACPGGPWGLSPARPPQPAAGGGSRPRRRLVRCCSPCS